MDIQCRDRLYDDDGTEYTVVHVDRDCYVIAWPSYDGVASLRYNIGSTRWVEKQVRNDEVIYPAPASEYEYGDRVVHKLDSSGEKGVVIERRDDTTYVVAFNGSGGCGPLIETHSAGDLLPA